MQKKVQICEPAVFFFFFFFFGGGGGLAEGPSVSLPYCVFFVVVAKLQFFFNKPSLYRKRPNYANSHIYIVD